MHTHTHTYTHTYMPNIQWVRINNLIQKRNGGGRTNKDHTKS